MRKFTPVLGLTLVLIFQASGFAAPDDKRYTIKSGILEYVVTGNQNGIETLYFDDFGRREAREQNTIISVMGTNQVNNQTQYIDHEWSYNYDPSTNIATKINWKEAMAAMRGNQALRDFGEDMMKSHGGRKTGTKEILGKSCDVWEIEKFSTQTCIYKNSVPLETNSTMAGMTFNSVATRFEENANVPAEKVRLPETAQVREMEMPEFAMPLDENGNPIAMPNIADMMQQAGEAQEEAPAEDAEESLSAKELALREKELELKARELDLREQEMAQQQPAPAAKKSAIEQVDRTVNTTNKVKNTFSGVRSLLGR